MNGLARKIIVSVSVGCLALVAIACENTEPEVQVFELVPVGTRNISVSVEAAGSVEPIMTVEVKSKASGEIFEMPVEIGDKVSAGDLLIRVDPRVPEATLRQAIADSVLAQAELETALSQLRRSDELRSSGSITEVEYEDARLAVASARASVIRAFRSLEDARIANDDTEVRAPISGVVMDKRVEEGTVITSATSGASAGTVLLQMANLDSVHVRSLVDETDIGRVAPGQQVTITVDAYPNNPFRGTVLKIEPQAEVSSNVTMFPVLVRIPNEQGLLRPGMNGEVEIQLGRDRDAIAVPNTALRTFRDFTSAATVLGLDPQVARQQVLSRRRQADTTRAPGMVRPDSGSGRGMGSRRLSEIELPDGVTEDEVREALRTRRSEGEEALTQRQRSLLQQTGFGSGQMGNRPRNPNSAEQSSRASALEVDYIVFVSRDGVPTPVLIRGGLSDGSYIHVSSGLSVGDTVFVLTSGGATAAENSGPGMGGRGMGRGGRPRF